MLELHLQRVGDTLTTSIAGQSTSVPLIDVAPFADTWQRVYNETVAYGRELFDKTFREEQMRSLLTGLPANERLLLVADDSLVATIPWEYLRDANDKLLAARLNLVRGLPREKQRADFAFKEPLEIVAIPVLPVDEPVTLNVEREWSNLVKVVTGARPPRSLALKRLRPPTPSKLERALGLQGTSIVHFMGHSASLDGKAFLVFEDARASKYLVDAVDFADSLNARVFLAVLNSCLSAVVEHTEFGNIAQTLATRGVPYALGMQFVLPDNAALVLSDSLYGLLLQGYSVEEAVMRTRRALAEPGKLPGLNPAWLAGMPVLYTSLAAPAPAIHLTEGRPIVQPDPAQQEQTCDMTALPQASHFTGRGEKISEGLSILLNPHQRGFVLLHGLGGIGKTSLARALAERVNWLYDDRVLAYSFEIFARLDAQNRRIVDDTFVDRFYNRLARFYGIDAGDNERYPTTVALQQAIHQRRAHVSSLLVLDNVETLIDLQKEHPAAQALATFVSKLKEGEGAVLLTSRAFPPADWGDYTIIPLSGLSDEAGAELFLALLPEDRQGLASLEARRALSHRVEGHPLSIRLLAGRFEDDTGDLDTFLKNIEDELEAAEQATPSSSEDPARQKTLYACLDYSVKRLTPDQATVLQALSLFQAPFPSEFAGRVVGDEQTTLRHLQTLARLSLLEISDRSRRFKEGELVLLELHPMVRWYITHHMPEPSAMLRERYATVYENLVNQAYEAYNKDAPLRYLLRQSLPDCEVALQLLPPASRSLMAYQLAGPYQRLGQNRRALDLYEQSLEIDQELGDVHSAAVTQSAMADVLRQQGKPQEALALYERVLPIYQELGDVRSAAVTQHAMADVLRQQGKPQEALALYEQALRTKQELGDVRSVAVTQSAMADVLRQQGKPQEAMALYEQALRTMQELGDMREVAATQVNFGQLLLQQGEVQRALMMIWSAYTSLQQHGYTYDAQTVQRILASIKGQVLGLGQFDRMWAQVFQETQPDWLASVEAATGGEEQGRISPAELEMIVSNTVTVMTDMPEKRDEWREAMEGALQQARSIEQAAEVDFFSAVLLVLDEQEPSLPEGHPYTAELEKIRSGITAGGLQEKDTAGGVSAEVMQAVRDFVGAKDWEATRQVVESQQALLFSQEVDALFELNITQARADGDERAVRLLEMHLVLLRACQESSIEETFSKLTAAREEGDEAEEAEEVDLPFDTKLISRSVEALLSKRPQEKMAHMQYLANLENETADEELKQLLNTIKLALFSQDFSQLGRDLQGVYRQAWGTIAATVEAGGVDPQLFATIASNTLVVLGPAAGQRSVWRSNLAEMRNQATAKGDRHMAALLDAVIGLLDAGGDSVGLGEGLQGIYARTWQAIVQGLPK